MKKLVAIFVAVMFLLCSSLAIDSFAMQGGKGEGMMMKHKGMGMMKGKEDLSGKFCGKAGFILKNGEELALTPKQEEDIKNLKAETKKALIKNQAEIEVIEVDIETALWMDAIDTAAVNVLVDKKYELKKEKTKMLVNALANLKNILTPEQKTKLKGLYKKQM